eukprot:scaffold195708_cov20-Prasinocladus_malaysianus.AAC.1
MPFNRGEIVSYAGSCNSQPSTSSLLARTGEINSAWRRVYEYSLRCMQIERNKRAFKIDVCARRHCIIVRHWPPSAMENEARTSLAPRG